MTTTATFNLDTDDPTLSRLLRVLAVDPSNHDLMRVMADRLEELVSVSDEAAGLTMAFRLAAERKADLRLFDSTWFWNFGRRYFGDIWDDMDKFGPLGTLLDAFRRLSIAMKRAGVTA